MKELKLHGNRRKMIEEKLVTKQNIDIGRIFEKDSHFVIMGIFNKEKATILFSSEEYLRIDRYGDDIEFTEKEGQFILDYAKYAKKINSLKEIDWNFDGETSTVYFNPNTVETIEIITDVDDDLVYEYYTSKTGLTKAGVAFVPKDWFEVSTYRVDAYQSQTINTELKHIVFDNCGYDYRIYAPVMNQSKLNGYVEKDNFEIRKEELEFKEYKVRLISQQGLKFEQIILSESAFKKAIKLAKAENNKMDPLSEIDWSFINIYQSFEKVFEDYLFDKKEEFYWDNESQNTQSTNFLIDNQAKEKNVYSLFDKRHINREHNLEKLEKIVDEEIEELI